ncbi:MAG: hypothetical protein C5S46_02410 [Candidatus Methanomarinus sp.]|uniref:Uncharacterized protein n=1 Tax=Candidatus Methanomarinus sp. TaxID=3386244 RepID=A0AC61SBR4_9EURY|nr:MAG: Ycf48-like protein [ANME-2 cluster archaeon HR1]TKY92099.1 MAG: hypothetical protein C5S46_02410 [ANME-2 cluster archaeon]
MDIRIIVAIIGLIGMIVAALITVSPYFMPTSDPTPDPTPIGSPTSTSIPTSAPTQTAPSETPTHPPIWSWQKIDGLPRQINTLVVDPTNSHVLYAGTGASGLGSSVYKSVDAGMTWYLASDGLPSEDVEALALSHDASPILYAAADSGDIFTSTNGAESWTQLGNVELMGFENRLAVAPSDENVLFIVKDTRGVACSSDGGYNWWSVGKGLPQDEYGDVNAAQSLAIDPTDANVVYLGTGWGSFYGNGVYKSIDGGETWSPSNKGMLDYGITALAVNPMDPQIVYAGGDNGELFKSNNGGATWSTIQLPDQTSIHDITIDPITPETIYLLCERVGIFISKDGGATWHVLGKPIKPDYPSFTAMAIIFEPQQVLIVGVRDEGGWRYVTKD